MLVASPLLTIKGVRARRERAQAEAEAATVPAAPANATWREPARIGLGESRAARRAAVLAARRETKKAARRARGAGDPPLDPATDRALNRIADLFALGHSLPC